MSGKGPGCPRIAAPGDGQVQVSPPLGPSLDLAAAAILGAFLVLVVPWTAAVWVHLALRGRHLLGPGRDVP